MSDPNGNPVAGFRYLLQQDTSHPVIPGVQVSNSLTLGIHNSYAPVLASGHTTGSSVVLDINTTQRHVLSILPDAGYAAGGAILPINQEIINVVVNPLPAPTAQISILVFEDNKPINNLPDLPQESGLEGFSVIVHDAAGQANYDVFGNPIGSTYVRDAVGNPVLNPDGTPILDTTGSGVVKTDAKGEAWVRNLAPGKYGIQIIPPTGSGWIQTNTIEGTRTIDAWVKAGEPAQFGNFGPPNKHVWFGFVKPFNNLPAPTIGSGTVSGRIVNAHNSAPPDFTFNPGHPLPNCWIGLNSLESRTGVYVAPCNEDSTFSIANVPVGEYQLAIWDTYLNNIFALQAVTIPVGGGDAILGDIPVFRWFSYFKGVVFVDHNENGFRECYAPGGTVPTGNPDDCDDPIIDDVPITEQNINLRFRDGSIYQSFPTDLAGEAPFDEFFPFLKFLVAEVDYARYKATGATIITDGGGPVLPDQGWDYPSRGVLTPQPQCQSWDPVTKACINPIINPNTGNNLSRTVVGPVLTQATQALLGLTNIIEWGKKPYGPDEHGGITGIVYYATTRAENDPRYAAAEPWEPGIPRVTVNLYQDSNADGVIDDLNNDGQITQADAVQTTTTDSWDDNMPTGCQAPPFSINGGQAQDCFEGLRTFNQVRDGVFDGGYAFTTYFPGGINSGSVETPLPVGFYITEVVPPTGYQIVKEEDRNVDFGDSYVPSPLLLPPECVGNPHTVPAEMSLFPGTPAPYAGQTRPLCDRKSVVLTSGKNAAADFYLFTEVPPAARVVGFLLNDLANVFDPNHPSYGEKAAPPWLPISIQDHTGKEIARIYSDEFGTYNALIPSTYTVNVPSPSGVSPNMLSFCLNDPGPIVNPADTTLMITDPFFDPQYAQVCYTADFWPGKTTYLDTPVLPVAATAGRTDYPLDCEQPTATPEIYAANGPTGGPYVASTGQTITLTSGNWNGQVLVANPAYVAGGAEPLQVARDYGFGTTPGTVTLGGVPLTIGAWDDVTITATIPAGVTTGELIITRGDNGMSSQAGVTVTVGGPAPVTVPVGGIIQDAIDAATPGSLILVPPGIYNEVLVMWKNVKLQGYGATSTIIDATSNPAMITGWYNKINGLITAGSVDYLTGQTALSNLEEGPGIFVIAKNGDFAVGDNARIDGFTIKGATNGGAILVNGFASRLEISNNRLLENQGNFGGGIRVGHPYFQDANGGFIYPNAFNTDLNIHHNLINKNGMKSQAGAGIALYTGSDRYRVTGNFICGNFSAADGGGIGHLGLSPDGLIQDNTIVFNQVFQQTAGGGGAGGGIFVAGFNPGTGALSTGSGNVTINRNLIQGNQAGADDGGAIALRYINGQDTAGAENTWHTVTVANNIMTNNITALAGTVSLQDALKVNLIHNTVANNDSTATSAAAFSGGISISTPHAAGVISRVHTTGLAGAIAGKGQAAFSNPVMANNIIWHNRAFYWDVSLNGGQGDLSPQAGGAPVYMDLAVYGTAGSLNPTFSTLTNTTGYAASNSNSDPLFVSEYFNGGPSHLLLAGPLTNIQTIPAFDEGGNFIDISMGPLTLIDPTTGTPFGDYHIQGTSPALNAGNSAAIAGDATLQQDFDGQYRPGGTAVDMGADEADGTLTPPVPDTDGDGVLDNMDNCILVANPNQLDTDGDGFGNLCDADLNNDAFVNLLDFNIFVAVFGTTNLDADFDGNGFVNLLDYNIFVQAFGKVPGPSGLVP